MLNQEQARQITKKLKSNYGFTYNQIAETIGVSANHLYHFISGERNLNRDKIFKLENILKSIINEKLGDEIMNV